MSEEIENEEVKELSSTENFIDAVTAKDFVSASKEFEELMLSKVDNALEQEKINIASQVYDPDYDEDEDDGLPSDVEPEQVEDDEEEEDHIENDAEDEDYDDDTEEDSESEDEYEEDEYEEDEDLGDDDDEEDEPVT